MEHVQQGFKDNNSQALMTTSTNDPRIEVTTTKDRFLPKWGWRGHASCAVFRSWARPTLCAVAHISGRNTLMARPFIDVCENNYPMVARSTVMVIVREREHALSWRMHRAQVDGFLPKFGRPDSLHVPSRYPRLTWNLDGTRVHFWTPMDAHVGHRQFDQRARAQTDGKIFVTSTLNGKPLLDQSDGSWHWRGAEWVRLILVWYDLLAGRKNLKPFFLPGLEIVDWVARG